ncbi:hypothetical protein Tco_1301699 [Tanacetum coccineum]
MGRDQLNVGYQEAMEEKILESVFNKQYCPYLNREDLNAVFNWVMDKYHDELPEGFERVLWGGALKVLFKCNEQDEFWNSQHEWKNISKELASPKANGGVKDFSTILSDGLKIDKNFVKGNQLPLVFLGEDLTCPKLKRYLNKELSIPEQTATGKGTSNPLMAGSLPKTTKPT